MDSETQRPRRIQAHYAMVAGVAPQLKLVAGGGLWPPGSKATGAQLEMAAMEQLTGGACCFA
ncbi:MULTISPECIES: hypothetical protein [Paraburkholderia]|uniref:hypothetical protein n=1 Tax=Paraburkholderia TaxID=1822464 RepID=UPI001CC6FCCD|nr:MULTISPECIES: hypothetical protein [Paraburkholderia]BEU26190.1 hypothetical protein PBP221_63300 [Paraburkholderia sp. 22B1P]GJG99558.1 hypothetical protein CBA19C8_03400 [Paraburkholderia terrae]